jgi:hypothetical protein
MRTSTLLSVAALAAIVAAPALAQPPGGGRGGFLPPFETQDANKDGKVTKEELTASLPEQAKQFADRIFESRDINPKDGAITKAESDAAPAMGRGGGRGPGGAPGQAPAQ